MDKNNGSTQGDNMRTLFLDRKDRIRRKKAPAGAGNVESVTPGEGEASNDRKIAHYHCNYCNKDISGMIRIKCVQCPDFDLCVECFSVGAEVYPHKSNHPYRVMDNLSFPLICPDWNADEEILLLEGIAMYGVSNWAEVAEHVGTKSKSDCIDHYDSVYMNSPCFPLPDLSHVIGKKREELQAMAKEHHELQKSFEDASLREEFPYSATVKFEEQQKEVLGSMSSQPDAGWNGGSSTIITGKAKKPFSAPQDQSGHIKVEDTHSDRKVGEKKPKMDEGPSVTDLSGYNPKRQEFEVEYDNDAEQLLADMEFKDTDTKAERDLKLEVVRVYNRRLDERKRRKDFILERILLHPDHFEKNLLPEERQLCQKYKAFMRYHSKEDHEELLKTAVEEYRIRKRIADLQEAKAAGCRTSAEADRYLAQKKRRQAEGKHCGPSSTASVQPRATSLDSWDVIGSPGADLLSQTETRLCREIRILPPQYLSMLQTMSMDVMKGKITKKADAHSLFRVDPRKVDRVYDMLVRKGLAPK